MREEYRGDWVLREELFVALHRWYLIVLFILIGGGVAVGISYIIPIEYRASVELAVDLNPYRALEDRYVAAFANFEFRNVDDYKHWQMSQLNLLVYSDEYLHAVLESLQSKDPDWRSIQINDLRKKVSAQWRNAGRWLLYVQAPSPQLAREAVSTWKDVIIKKTSEAIESSQHLYQLELELRALNGLKFNLQSRRELLIGIKNALTAIQSHWSGSPSWEHIALRDRWRLADLAAQAASFNPVWKEVMADLPDEDGTVKEYSDWIERVNLLIGDEIRFLEQEIQGVTVQLTEQNSRWAEMLASARGLAATLSVKSLREDSPQVRPVRSSAGLMLVGGLSGVLLWALFQTYQITRRLNNRCK
mgnify:CR=1 FL=1